ncbi:flagellar hook-length control protein FliK [Microvirga alba]|uniref:Flagellar hook-length control protein FliK n=1 Tax=Microvirga alba TaxID=2791025 RepID=A0A931FM05_9HYPH|nr:flagellar hook-length control protein FliK [Microvirga alba]MBF9232609.1 flagellar hook-length control protein FliK [Microvirga alba]
MNKLDTFLQNASRRTDTLPMKSNSQSGDNSEGASNGADALAFSALLEDLSASSTAGRDTMPSTEEELARSVGLSLDSGIAKSASGDTTRRSPETRDDKPAWGAETVATRADWADTALLGRVLSITTQPLPVDQIDAAQRSVQSGPSRTTTDSAASLLDLLQPQSEGGDAADHLLNLSNTSRQKASVLHQETHFKPVTSAGGLFEGRSASDDGPMPGASAWNRARSQDQTAPDDAFSAKSAVASQSRNRGDSLLTAVAMGDRESVEPSPSNSIPHRIANAIIGGAERTSAQLEVQSRQTDLFPTLATMRPSEAAVRVLNIQLHPVELGLVTVKMRLSGEKLEMELHVSSDETAQILRRDSEKLSSLLRTAGYRPDSLTIHTAGVDVSQQDSSFGQRQQSTHQSQSQSDSFQQGATGSDERSRKQAQDSDAGSPRALKDETDEIASPGRGNGGLYL